MFSFPPSPGVVSECQKEQLQWGEETEKWFMSDVEDVVELLSTGEKGIVQHVVLGEVKDLEVIAG